MHNAQLLPQVWNLALDESVNLLAAIVILCAGWMLANAANRWTSNALSSVHHIDPTLKPLTAALVRYAIIAFTAMAVLERFGVRTTSVVAMLGAAGIAVGLALQGTLSNVASGVMLLLLRAFRVGDEISTGSCAGVVREIGLFRTVLITGDGIYMSVPNTTIFSEPIINNSREPTRQVHFKVTIDHLADIEKAQAVAMEILHGDERVLKSPAPGVPVSELGDTYVTLTIAAWTLTSNFGNLQSDLQKLVRQRFRETGIKPPQRLVSVGGAASPAQAAAAEVASETDRRKSA
jgi:small conductance mechanosensitive channel